jgi:hypothetical protein
MYAKSGDPKAVALGVGMIVRGLTDDDPATLRQGWPMTEAVVEAAARYLDVKPTPELISAVLAVAPTISDAMLNRRPGATRSMRTWGEGIPHTGQYMAVTDGEAL